MEIREDYATTTKSKGHLWFSFWSPHPLSLDSQFLPAWRIWEFHSVLSETTNFIDNAENHMHMYTPVHSSIQYTSVTKTNMHVNTHHHHTCRHCWLRCNSYIWCTPSPNSDVKIHPHIIIIIIIIIIKNKNKNLYSNILTRLTALHIKKKESTHKNHTSTT